MTHSRSQVLDVAFSIVRERGVAALTARGIARILGTSTSPIFSNFRSMAELMPALAGRAETLLAEYQSRERTGDQSIDLALGYVDFARSEPRLFWEVLSKTWRGREPNGRPIQKNAIARMRRDPRLATLSDKSLLDIRRKMRIFIHGIASLSRADAAALPDKMVESLIHEMGVALVRNARSNEAEQEQENRAESSAISGIG